MSDAVPFLRRVAIENYKSIAKCEVELKPLTVLVGRNGSGKSNFLDALRFVTDALVTSLDHAIRSRGGIDDVRRRSTGHPRNFGVRLDVQLSKLTTLRYGFEITARPRGSFAVKTESAEIRNHLGIVTGRFRREENEVSSETHGNLPRVLEDRLYLVNASGVPEFRPACDALIAMGFYNLEPEAMREPQAPDAGELLHHNGSNVASVVARLAAQQPVTMERITAYLGKIVPAVENVERVPLGKRETLHFLQKVHGAKRPWRFNASSMSDGTLRALGALVAVSQVIDGSQTVRLVGIEEPETALHPAAAGALMDALREGARHTQAVIITHSTELLDAIDVQSDGLLAVVSRDGNTEIAPADPASTQAIYDHLYSAGDLLRADQIEPDRADLRRQSQMELFPAVTEQ